MGYTFKILGSSSSGNCSFLKTDNACILIDAGFSGRQIEAMLEAAGESVGDIEAVFITHEHSDHCKGVRGLARHGIEFYANPQTAKAIQQKLEKPAQWRIFQTGQPFLFKDIHIESIPLPHDSYDPVGFRFSWGEDDLFNPHRTLAWITDLGHAPKIVREKIKEVDYLVVESNHDVRMLENDMKRPFSLKRRILGQHGHLSNDAALALLQTVERPRWREIFLAHLSKDCNSPSLVEETFSPFCHTLGCRMQVVNPFSSNSVTISG
jgi:phosphoribosyl 1,2-cyclic phosphodiesterase